MEIKSVKISLLRKKRKNVSNDYSNINKSDEEQGLCSVTTYPRRWWHIEVPAHQERTFTIKDMEENTWFSLEQKDYYFYIFGGDIGTEPYSHDDGYLEFMRYLFNNYTLEFTYDVNTFHRRTAWDGRGWYADFKFVKKYENKGTILKPMTEKETAYYWDKYISNQNGR